MNSPYPLTLISVIIFACLLINTAQGQVLPSEKQLDKSNQQWFTYSAAITGSGKYSSLVEASYRSRAWVTEPAQYLFRGNVYYAPNAIVRWGGGLVFSSFYTSGQWARQEWRPNQEVSLKQTLGKLSLNNRLQVEERFIHLLNQPAGTDNRRFNFRFRYRMQATIALIGPRQEDGGSNRLQLVVGDEIMLNAGQQIVTNTFDQNRFTVGPSWQPSKNLNLGLIYLNLFSATAMPGNYRLEHIVRLDLRQTIKL